MADDNWKERLGIKINVSTDEDEDEDCSTNKYDDLLPPSQSVDDILRKYGDLGSTPPRTRIRNKDKSRRDKDQGQKSSPRVIYGGRSSLEKNIFRNFESLEDEVDSKSSKANKRSMQRLRGSERDLKIDMSVQRPRLQEERAESLPPQTAFKIYGLQVESCNRFMSLASTPVVARPVRGPFTPHPPMTSIDECSHSRLEFYQTFSMLIKMGNPDRHDVATCRRQLSREESLWQNELKDLIWLELQAWHADRTPHQQDQHLCEAREAIQPLLQTIIQYKFRKRRPIQDPSSSNDSGIHIPIPVPTTHNEKEEDEELDEEDDLCSCVSMFCERCMDQQDRALQDVEWLMTRLQAAEALFPSSKAFAARYSLYKSNEFNARVKAMCVWYNLTKHHRLKLLILSRHLLCHAETSSVSCIEGLQYSIDTFDLYNTKPLLKAADYLEQVYNDHTNSPVFKKYLEDVLKTKGLNKALHFLEKLHLYLLRKATYTLQRPELDLTTVKESESFEDQELQRYGFWSSECQAMGLPSYRSAYLFISHVPLAMIHAYLRLRLETKPEKPSVMSIRQLIQELKEGLRLAVLIRQRYLYNVNTSLWNCEPDVINTFTNRITAFDISVQSVLEVYLDYLRQWVQMIQQERVQKNILKEEWSFISGVTKHIPGGQALVGSSFCRMATDMFKINRHQFVEKAKSQVDTLTRTVEEDTSSSFKQRMYNVCRKLQEVCVEGREKILNVLTLSKLLRKDLESEANESNRSSLCCNIIGDSLSQLKREALSLCECLSSIIQKVDTACCVPDDWEECDKDVLNSRIREVLHQFFKFGFEYHREISWLVTGTKRCNLARNLISFAQLWMAFVKSRCERGRGLRPRWANHGLEFIMTVCEPHFTNCLSDEEFENLKSDIDECISHVIGTAVANGGGSPGAYPRHRGVSPSPSAPRTPRPSRSERTASLASPDTPCEVSPLNDDKEDNTNVVTLICPSQKLCRTVRLTHAVEQLDSVREEMLKKENLIGNVLPGQTVPSEKTLIRTRVVTFGWQRGIKIGQGRFGKVYTAVNNETGELMAMKEIQLQPNDHRTIRNVATELKIFEGIHHENLVRYYGVEIHREEMLIFMELCTEGTLESLVSSTEGGLPEDSIRRYTLQLTKAVSTLHEHAIVHRDIKSANIFLTADGNCLKLGDFGSAVKIKAHTTVPGELQGFVGTQAYMAPEVFMKTNSDGHGRAVDVWSLGCVLVEMASGKRPWAEYDSNYQIMFKVGMGETPEIPTSLSEEGRQFAARCLVHDAKRRATTFDLLRDTFLRVEGEDECISCTMPSIREDYLRLGIKK